MNFYFEAGKVLDKIDAKRGSVKGILASVDMSLRKRMSALVIRTLEYKPILLEILKASSLLKLERKVLTSQNLALVLVHDLLFSRGIEAGDGPVKQAVLRHKTRLHSELVKIKIRKGVKDNRDLAQVEHSGAATIPRWVRVNRNVGTLEEATRVLQESLNLKLVEFGEEMTNASSFSVDPHVPDLLALHPSITLQSHSGYASGLFILQDKASCLPATVLSPPRNRRAVVIDATAAPGNKTSHLSALMGNVGKVYAFERDRYRFKTLEKMLEKARCTNVEATCQDFLESDPADKRFKDATHILLDPSCSGSGIVNRLDHLVEAENKEEDLEGDRLKKLAEFQVSMIRHAMKFPSMRKIVYSTCSIHAQENEQVVKAAMSSPESASFTIASRNEVLPQWSRRGLVTEMDDDAASADCLIRTDPSEDRTNGFFVACFVRKGDSPDSAAPSTSVGKRKHGSVDDAGGSAHELDLKESLPMPAPASRKKSKKRKKTAGNVKEVPN